MPPIEFTDGQTTEQHYSERLQVNLTTAHEDVEAMNIEVYFEKVIVVNGQEKSRGFDPKPLVFNCKNDPQLKEALLTIQQRIGVLRYAQITAPAPPPIPLGPLAGG